MGKKYSRQRAIIEAFQEIQKRQGLTGRKMSEKAGRYHSFFSEIYRGQHRPYLDEALDACDDLGVSAHELIELITKKRK